MTTRRLVNMLIKTAQRFLPKTYWGFPIEGPNSSEGDGTSPHSGHRGIALLIAIMIISVMMLFSSDLILSSQVNVTLATAQRDNIKAEYLAKSGFNASQLLLASDLAYDLYNYRLNPKAGLTDGLSDMWGALNGMPIGGETLEMAEQFQTDFGLNGVLDSGILDQLKLFDGMFTIEVLDESQKINVNYCAISKCTETMLMLDSLFSCPAEKAFLEQKKLAPRELTARLKDWADADSKVEEGSGFSDENEPYQKREPKMLAKNAPFDSVDEFRLIEGWDEEVHAVFSPFMTVFPIPQSSTSKKGFKVNINTASRSLLQCLFPETRGSCSEKVAQAMAQRDKDLGNLALPGVNMADVLRDLLCYGGEAGGAGEASNKASWFVNYSNVYRVQVRGQSGGSEKKIEAVVERVMPDPKKNEKSTSKLLYWKII